MTKITKAELPLPTRSPLVAGVTAEVEAEEWAQARKVRVRRREVAATTAEVAA